MKKNKDTANYENQLDLFHLNSKSASDVNPVSTTENTTSFQNDHLDNESDLQSKGKVVRMKGHLEDIYERILNRTMS